MEIAADLEQMRISINDNGFVATMQQVACPAVSAVEIDRVGSVEPMHKHIEISLRRHKEKVEVILHQNICEHLDSVDLNVGGKYCQEFLPVFVV